VCVRGCVVGGDAARSQWASARGKLFESDGHLQEQLAKLGRLGRTVTVDKTAKDIGTAEEGRESVRSQ
jgi:hypothetical protein